MEMFLHSLGFALLITGGIALFLCLAVIPRLHTFWKAKRGVSVTMPCQDAEELRFRVAEALKDIGKPTLAGPTGSFVIEPSNWRKKFGVRPITVEFLQPQLALITSQGPVLNRLAKTYKLLLVKDPNNTFGIFLRKQSKWFSWTMGLAFAVIFVLFMVNDPQGGGGRSVHAKVVPVERSYAPARSR